MWFTVPDLGPYSPFWRCVFILKFQRSVLFSIYGNNPRFRSFSVDPSSKLSVFYAEKSSKMAILQTFSFLYKFGHFWRRKILKNVHFAYVFIFGKMRPKIGHFWRQKSSKMAISHAFSFLEKFGRKSGILDAEKSSKMAVLKAFAIFEKCGRKSAIFDAEKS